MHPPDLLHQIPPLPYEGGDLGRLTIVRLSNVHQDTDLGIHQPDVGVELHPGLIYPLVYGQGLAAEDDAAIGFGWGHELQLANNGGAVNGGRP